jgi:hypothetical protein
MIAVPRKKTHEQNNNVDFENIIPQSSLFVSRCASLAPRAGIEPATVSLEGCCSIPLSYRGKKKSDDFRCSLRYTSFCELSTAS